jgi:hypothetical protein
MTTTDVEQYTFTITPEATATIARMHDHTRSLANYWGEKSTQYTQAATSLANVLARVFGGPMQENTRIWREGRPEELSLIVQTFMTVGVIFHRDKRVCTDPECHAMIEDSGAAYRFGGDVKVHDHTPSYPLDAPVPGTWSMHS